MLEIGKLNVLKVLQRNSSGVFLDAGEFGKLYLPAHGLSETLAEGDELEVFVYRASDGALVATLQQPLAQVGEIAWLRVIAKNTAGAFLDWGLPKDLFVPFSEQRHELEIGHFCLVKVLFDPVKGIAATTFIEDYLHDQAFYLREGQAVSLLIVDATELGFKAIINHTCWGLLYKNEVFQPLKKGQVIKGYIKRIRADDQKIDLSLYPPGYAKVESITDKILETLRQNQHFLPLSDKSSPAAIYARFGVSKKVYKQAIGLLYKQRLIVIEEQGIRLVS